MAELPTIIQQLDKGNRSERFKKYIKGLILLTSIMIIFYSIKIIFVSFEKRIEAPLKCVNLGYVQVCE